MALKPSDTRLRGKWHRTLSRWNPEKLVPWYLLSCCLPFLPYATTLVVTDHGKIEIWHIASLLVLAFFAIAFNILIGAVLVWQLRGVQRALAALGFVLGAILPIIVIISEYFHAPLRPIGVAG